MWSGGTIQTRLPRKAPIYHRGVRSPLPALEEAERPSEQPPDQESDLEEHKSPTQVELGPMTPAAALPTPLIALSKDSLPAHGLLTDTNADHPMVPSTGSTDKALTLPKTGRKHRQREMHLESKQFSQLQAKLGGFTHTSTPHSSHPNLHNDKDLLNFVKT
jgi:hypothetical protein